MKRQNVYELIDGERSYQEKKWNADTTLSQGFHSPAEWLIYMQDYLTEAVRFASRNPDPLATELVMNSIRKITTMGVAAMEQIETPSREEEQEYKDNFNTTWNGNNVVIQGDLFVEGQIKSKGSIKSADDVYAKVKF